MPAPAFDGFKDLGFDALGRVIDNAAGHHRTLPVNYRYQVAGPVPQHTDAVATLFLSKGNAFPTHLVSKEYLHAAKIPNWLKKTIFVNMKKRFVSLDVLRGITIAFMCIVNNPGTWSHIFPPLRHAGWVGCTPTDLVYPFFIFCMGCAMAFSFSSREGNDAKTYLKVLKRGALIFLVGLALNLYPFFPVSPHDETWSFGQNYLYWLQHKRIFGVLQRIGMAYALGGCLAVWLKKPGKILGAVGVLCVLYTAILLLFGREPGAFTLEGNVSMRIDEWLVGGDHCYHGYSGTNFDPEGLLGSMTAACTCLLGYLIGSMIIRSRDRMAATWAEGTSTQANGSPDLVRIQNSPDRVTVRIFVYGCLCLAFAMVLSIWIPISKPLWSASYVFYAGGWAMVALAFLMYVVDLKGHAKPFEPFRAMGMNPLMAFVCSGVIAKSYQFFNFSPSRYFGANEYTSLLYALIFVTVIFSILWVLYRKHIVIKL